MTLEICCFGETDFNALRDGSEVIVAERSLVSEKESGSCYLDDRVQKHGNKNSKRYKNKS